MAYCFCLVTRLGFFLCSVLFLERYLKYLTERSFFPNWEGFASSLLRLVVAGKLIESTENLQLNYNSRSYRIVRNMF